MKCKKLFASISIATTLFGCEPCLNSPCSDPILFSIIDKNNRQDLVIGPSAIYKIDSMSLKICPDSNLISNNCGYFASISSENNLLYTRPRFPFDTIYLRLSSSDIDTLIIQYDYRETKCCKPNGFGRVTGINYNGKIVTKAGVAFLFEK